ncbi:SPRY-domain-containing protein [Ascodesmis nigricans]|uniref:SPRY-domain-containing protein n=1 Tax=Ascodesmis nigricans TaxID=341454 RepID=A0A4V3SHV6_9PEZI|nr:SPRY-domain-containing protein [Ascodesmis nigricans]
MTSAVPHTYPGPATMNPRRSSFVTPHSSYASIVSGQAPAPLREQTSPHFGSSGSFKAPAPSSPAVVPSYLVESLYAERLASTSGSVFNSYSTSPLLPMSPRKIHRYRGVATDIVEHSPVTDELLSALPTRWDETAKSNSIQIMENGCEAKFIGNGKSNEVEPAGAVRADKPIPLQCGVFYFEVTIVSRRKRGEKKQIGIGFCGDKASLSKVPGWEADSWAYHGDEGESFCYGKKSSYGPAFDSQDVIGCGVNFRTRTAFFTKNGNNLGVAFRDINPRKKKFYPVVGFKRTGETVRVNFGQDKFVFDIDQYMQKEKEDAYAQIYKNPPVQKLCPPLEETALIQALISQYLSHECFVETARAFAEVVKNENRTLEIPDSPITAAILNTKHETDAAHRQTIRNAIVQGNIIRALKLTKRLYPNVLQDNDLCFRLHRRRLLEMFREISERVENESENLANGDSADQKSHHHSGDEMEVDEPMAEEATWDIMDMDDDNENGSTGQHIQNVDTLDGVVKYARQLRVQFHADTRPEIKKSLDEVFSLIAYLDPKSSVMAHLLDESERLKDAEMLNSAILRSQNKGPVAALERLVKQSSVLVQDLSEEGGPGAFVNIRNDFLKDNEVMG